jgi:hypothetical protein
MVDTPRLRFILLPVDAGGAIKQAVAEFFAKL